MFVTRTRGGRMVGADESTASFALLCVRTSFKITYTPLDTVNIDFGATKIRISWNLWVK